MNVMEKTPEDILIKYYEANICCCCNKEECQNAICIEHNKYLTKLFCKEYKMKKPHQIRV